MPHISQRAIDMPASPIRKLAPLASAAKEDSPTSRPRKRDWMFCVILTVRCWNIVRARALKVIEKN